MANQERTWWWMPAIAGVVSILFGIAALVWPGLTLVVLTYLFGIYAVVLGIVELIGLLRAAGVQSWAHAVVGVLSLLAGLVALFWPGETTVVLLYIIAIWAVTVGTVEIVEAFLLNRLDLALGGLVSVLFALLLFANPRAGALALILLIGVFAIVRGVILLMAARRAHATPAT